MKKNNWIYFYWGPVLDISFEICGYFDNRPRINLGLFFFKLTLILPFRNMWTDECDPPRWGIVVNNRAIWIYKGGKGNLRGGNKWWSLDIPFLTKDWVRTSILLEDNTWEHEYPGERKEFYSEAWKKKQKSWTYNFTDKYDNTIIPTTIYVEEREWRPKWCKFKLFAKILRTIDIHFSQEVGKRKASWKGGTLGCSYKLLPGEEPLNCLKRMEKERNF